MYNARSPPPGRETITIGDRRRIKVEYIGNMDVIFHRKSDQRITLIDVAYIPDLGFNLYSLDAVQRTHLIVSVASGTHIIGANLTFPRRSSGSYLRATRLPAGTVGARRRQGEMHATNLFKAFATPRSASVFAQRHLALRESTMDHSGPDCANKTAEGYLCPYAGVCARRRAISCTSRRSASSRTGIDDTAFFGIEAPGTDPPARWPRHKKRGTRGDAGEDAWRDPCNARRIAEIRPSPWRTIDDGTCGPGVNAGDSRINQQDRPSAQRPKRLAGPADRAYTRYLQTKLCIGSCILSISLEVFADADYASRATNRRSVPGVAIMCAGACV